MTLRASDAFGGVATRAVTITALAATPDPTKKYNVLVFSKTAGFRHGSIGPGITAIKLLGQQNNFGVDAIEDATLFTDAFLARYDAVIWLSTTGDVLNDTQQAAFERYIQAGGGYVGIHAASRHRVHVAVVRPAGRRLLPQPPGRHADRDGRHRGRDHASTSALPARWTRVDEWYNFQGIDQPRGQRRRHRRQPARQQRRSMSSLTVDESTYNESDGNTTDDDHPVSWCKRFDGGRMFYTALGHTNQSFTEAPFLQHLLNGIDVAAGYASDAVLRHHQDLHGRRRRRHRAGDAVADARHPGRVRRLRPRRRADLQRVHDRERDLDRRRRAAVGLRPQRHRDRAGWSTARSRSPQPLQATATSAAGTGGPSRR